MLKPDGNGKLSKRDGDRLGFPVFPLEWTNPEDGETSSGYKQKGFFPEAFVNMLAFLGWNPGTEQELFSLDELIQSFSLERVNKAGAKYDHDKTRWFNQQYLRSKTDGELSELLAKAAQEAGFANYDSDYLSKVAGLMKERAYFIKDMLLEGDYFFQKPQEYDAKTLQKKWNADARLHVEKLLSLFQKTDDFSMENLESIFKSYLETNELGFGKVGPGFRLAVTGKGMGPSMFEICSILGKEETLERMQIALDKLSL